jgi:hypothetical protein
MFSTSLFIARDETKNEKAKSSFEVPVRRSASERGEFKKFVKFFSQSFG